MNVTEARTNTIINYINENQPHDLQLVGSYGEEGYSTDKGVIIGDLNGMSERLSNYLEEAGFSLEFYDEWQIAWEHDKCYRTSPDSYSWQCAIHFTEDGEILTPDDDASEWVEAMMNNHRCALPSRIAESDITDEGFVLVEDDYASGWYGRDDSPEQISEKLREQFDTDIDVLFQLNGVGQFEIAFCVYYREL